MNCKPGDLAFIVITGSNTKGLRGRVITVLRRAPNSQLIPGVPHDVRIRWVYEPKLTTDDGIPVRWVNDCCLKPIRPDSVTDEEVRDLYAPDRSMKDSPLSDTTSPSEKKEPA